MMSKVGFAFIVKSLSEIDTVQCGSIEHIKPKSKTEYTLLKFAYSNLTYSCFGYPEPVGGGQTPSSDDVSCNQKKGDNYCDDLFLDPTCLEDISAYFEWDRGTGEIIAGSKDRERAQYMIDLLNLDCNHLRIARINARTAANKMLKFSSLEQIKLALENGSLPFSSFLLSHPRYNS